LANIIVKKKGKNLEERLGRKKHAYLKVGIDKEKDTQIEDIYKVRK
jgi:hypothetical protein